MIARLNPRSRRDAYGSRINRDHSPLLAYSVPWLTILIGSLLPLIPMASAIPLIPPMGFLFLIAWRLVRPGLLPMWAGFPLGLFDDLFSGQPFGSAVFLWSVTMLVVEGIETRFPWRSFYQDWLVATLLVGAYLVFAAVFSGADIELSVAIVLIPQYVLSILVFPLVARLVARLDRFRLLRVRSVR
ncbi:rod shape-determining protein MreD [Altererythrobacter sp. SALINAS58]|uniref:rod shape-determining protein MreD n=1 Tax=Alteripontixanthobacter muriae TaxID=2705546 RepID=UPI001576A36A|nr:rod shape-determining protein MreD [Alteripontixanthobacter muriae]NTZ41842.1 rod shape-determining protein MreD [Alteripontixanthobacter muriae]